jgi:hypothetical protein
MFPLLFMLITARASDLPRFSLFNSLDCKIKSNFIFLDDKQKSLFEAKNKIELNSRIIKRFDVNCSNNITKAYLLTDRVRTHYQTLLIWIKNSKVAGLETIYFKEPKEYKAPLKWTKTIKDKEKSTLYQVDALSGATLTRQSTLKLVKKSLLFEQL